MQRKRYSAQFKREAVKLASQPGMVKRRNFTEGKQGAGKNPSP
jgi:transposase-like protein